MPTILLYAILLIALQLLLNYLVIIYRLKKYLRLYPVEAIQRYPNHPQHLLEALQQQRLGDKLLSCGFELAEIFHIDIHEKSYILLYLHPISQIQCAVILSPSYQLTSYELLKSTEEDYLNLCVSQYPVKIYYAQRTFYQLTPNNTQDFCTLYKKFAQKCESYFSDVAPEPSIDFLEIIQQQYRTDLNTRLQQKRIKLNLADQHYSLTLKGLCLYSPAYLFPFNKLIAQHYNRQAKKFYAID